MKQCPNCRNQITDEAVFCPICGTSISAYHSFPEPYPPQHQAEVPPYQTGNPYPAPPVKVNPYDHTALFETSDIAEHKNWCMLLYLLDFIGIALVLLAKHESEYIRFHMTQAVKYTVLEALLAFISVLFSWTVVAPFLCAAALIVLTVLKFISFLQVCNGKAVEPAIVRSLKFLR